METDQKAGAQISLRAQGFLASAPDESTQA
jgi:hypothetical protein